MYREEFVRVRTVRLRFAAERTCRNGGDEFFAVFAGLLDGRRKLKQVVACAGRRICGNGGSESFAGLADL